MKRYIALALILTLILTFIPSCSDNEEDVMEENLSAEITGQYETLLAAFDNTDDIKDMKDYLLHWAKDNGIKASHDAAGNVILSKNATEGYEDAPSTIFQCTLSLDDIPMRSKSIATALYILKESDSHGFVRTVFTIQDEDGNMIGAEKLKENYLKGDYLISLDFDKKNSVLLSGAGKAQYELRNNVTWQVPSYYKAYEISIQGLAEWSPSEAISKPNPIKIIGDILATSKSNGILFELASFNGGLSADTYPTAATAVVIITQNDIARFTKRIENSQSKFEDKYRVDNPNYTYTFREVEMPDKVFSHEDSSSLVSLLYTMINGVYLKSDDGEIVASTNLGVISTHTGILRAGVGAQSLSQETLDEITLVFDTICGLSDMEYEFNNIFPVWAGSEKSEILLRRLQASTEEAFGKKAKSTSTLEPTVCSIFNERNPNLAVVAYGLTEEDFTEQTEGLLYFLRDLAKPESEFPAET